MTLKLDAGDVKTGYRPNQPTELAEILCVASRDQSKILIFWKTRYGLPFDLGRDLKFGQGGELTFCGNGPNVYL